MTLLMLTGSVLLSLGLLGLIVFYGLKAWKMRKHRLWREPIIAKAKADLAEGRITPEAHRDIILGIIHDMDEKLGPV